VPGRATAVHAAAPTGVVHDPEPTRTYHDPGTPADAGSKLPSIPGYELLGVLGRGGMGVVYHARHLALKRAVALKMIRAASHAGPQELARFRSEAQAVARLQHPNIVQLFEVGEHEGLPFCALEFVQGGALQQRLAGRPLPAREAARLVEALAGAMHLAHSRNLVHRDLKPANVLLTADGTPKITDFGLARQLDRPEGDSGRTQAGAIMGTPSYMAPEQARGQTHAAGPAADVYALGAILYACLTGRPPFQGATKLETLEQVRSQEPVPPGRWNARVPCDLETICLKCLQKEPERRYGSARELADDLGRFRRGEPVLARPVGTPARLAKWARRRPAVAGLLLSLLVLSLAVSGLLVSFWLDAEAARAAEADARAKQAREGKRQAEENARAATVNLERGEDALAENLMQTVGYTPTPVENVGFGNRSSTLTPAEVTAFHDLAEGDSERVRFRFLEKALARPETAVRLGQRSEVVIQATVGLSRERQRRVMRLLLGRLRDGQAPPEVRDACLRLGLALQTSDPDFCREAANAAIELLGTAIDFPTQSSWAQAVGTLAPHLLPEDAAAMARKLLVAMDKPANASILPALAQEGVTKLATRLPREEASRLATAAARKLLDTLAKPTHPSTVADVADAVTALGTHLPAEEAGRVSVAVARKALADLLQPANPVFANLRYFLTRALASLAGHLPPEEAAALVRKLLQGVAQANTSDHQSSLMEAADSLAAHLPPKEACATAEALLDQITNSPNATARGGALRTVSALAARLPPEEAAATAQKFLDAIIQRNDPDALSLLTQALRAMVPRLTPKESSRIAKAAAGALLDVLNKTPDLAVNVLSHLAQEVGKWTPYLRPEEADRVSAAAAQKLLDAMTKTTDPLTLHPMAQALAVLASQLPPAEAGPVSAAAVHKLLDARAKAAGPNLHYLFLAVAVLAAHLTPEEAAATADKLLDAIATTPAPYGVLSSLGQAMTAVAPRLPVEKAAPAARRLLEFLGKPTDPFAKPPLAQAVVALASRLPPEEEAALVPKLFAILSRTNQILDPSSLVLAVSVLAARLPPDEAAATAQRLIEALTKPIHPSAVPALVQAVAALAATLPPEQAAATAQKALDALAGNSFPNAPALGQVLATLAPRLRPEQAAARKLLDALTKTTDPLTLYYLTQAVSALASRLSPEEAAGVALPAAQQLLDTMAKPANTYALPWLAPVLGEVASRLPPAQAATVMAAATQKLSDTAGTDFRTLALRAQALAALAPRLSPEEIDRSLSATARALLDALAQTGTAPPPSTDQQVRADCSRALNALTPRLTTAGLIVVLKQPTCVGAGRQTLLKELGRRRGPPTPEAAAVVAGAVTSPPPAPLAAAAVLVRGETLYPGGRRPFDELWEAVDWLQEQHQDLNLISAPPSAAP
jgi:hypothetical protein